MTDKEPIDKMIELSEDLGLYEDSCDMFNEYAAQNWYFKQLARKTAECEEQENKIKKLRKNLALEIEINDRYRKALDEIEEYIKRDCGCECTYCLEQGDCKFQEILNIINKVKGE